MFHLSCINYALKFRYKYINVKKNISFVTNSRRLTGNLLRLPQVNMGYILLCWSCSLYTNWRSATSFGSRHICTAPFPTPCVCCSLNTRNGPAGWFWRHFKFRRVFLLKSNLGTLLAPGLNLVVVRLLQFAYSPFHLVTASSLFWSSLAPSAMLVSWCEDAYRWSVFIKFFYAWVSAVVFSRFSFECFFSAAWKYICKHGQPAVACCY